MRKLCIAIVLCLVALGMQAQFTSAPAFPGAEGFGRYVTGGRGGKVVHVTNLNDSGTGSLRAAVRGDAKKIIVFDVAGVIALNSDLVIGANTTILGQTAPRPGVTVRYYTVRPGANNIIRFMRFRRGQERDVNDGGDAMWQRCLTGIIIDHCSFSWSIDEVASFYDNNNFTLQWCTLGESLNNTGHTKDAHGYGGIWGGKLASFHHNLLLHVMNRSPRFNGARYNWEGYTANQLYSTYKWKNSLQAENVDFRNCVMYNWGTGNGCYGGPGGGQINIVNNYYKAGPATTNKTRVTQISVADANNSGNNETYAGMTSRYYIHGNYVTAATNPANYDWSGVKYDLTTYKLNGEYYTPDTKNYYGDGVEHTTVNGVSCVKIKMDVPSVFGDVTTHSATTAFQKVLAHAGSSLFRDDVDARYARETRYGITTYAGSVTAKPGIIDLVSDVNGYTEKNFGTGSQVKSYDGDYDGISDAWETANGLDPKDPADARTYTLDPKGYYTNLEVYANSLVERIVREERADAEDSFEEYYPKVTLPAIQDEAVAKRKFDFIVGRDGDIDAAIAAANAYNGEERFLIFIPDGTHQLTGNQTITLATTKEALTGTDGSTVQPGATFTNAMTWLKKSRVSLIGQSEDKTILTNTPLYPGISYTSTLEIRKGYSDNYLQDFTLHNNYADGAHNKGVAVAFYDRGTNTILKNVRCWSNQDTYTSQATRCYYENATFAGTVDFICGSGDVWFEGCNLIINDRSGNVITAPRTAPSELWGYVFNGCTISLAEGATAAKNGNWNLGRPWNSSPAATYLYTRMHTTPTAAGWTKMTNGCVLRFHEYGSMNQDGSAVNLSGRNTTACNGAEGSDAPVLTAEEAAAYTVEKVVGNNGTWDPVKLTRQVSVDNLKVSGGTLTWAPNDAAMCWVVFRDGVYYDNVSTNSISVSEGATYTVRAANEMGGLGVPATLEYRATAVRDIPSGKGDTLTYNLAGQRVNDSARGLVIKEGKKYLVK